VLFRSPLALSSNTGVAFDRLSAPTAIPSSASGPRVTVIMSAFRPNDDTIHAVRAITHQTWRDWELLVMDDASGPAFDDIFERIAALDERITVVRSEVNAGTYVRRNEALNLATGDFVTMQDSDDWSHPRRLELQVQHLLAHPEEPANLTSALRVSSDLLFTQGRGLYLRLSEPSLMFRRELVVGRIGYFDSTRKSADSEYRVRIGAAFGREVPHLTTRGPLMLMRFDLASLSGSDLADGWTHPARIAYRSSYKNWIDSGGTRPHGLRMPFPLERRLCPAPTRITGEDADRGEVDVLLVVDARRGGTLDHNGGAVRSTVRALTASGRRVAIMHASGFMHGAQEKLMCGHYHRVIAEDGVVEFISRGETIHARTVVVLGRGAMLGVPADVGVRADETVMITGVDDPIVTEPFAAQLCAERFGHAPRRLSPAELRQSLAVAETDGGA